MSTWEERMSQRAHARMAAQAERERGRREAEQAEYERQLQEEQRAEFEAGPPNGCQDCYVWDFHPNRDKYIWWHITISEGDQTCYHECHGGEPVWCGPVAYA